MATFTGPDRGRPPDRARRSTAATPRTRSGCARSGASAVYRDSGPTLMLNRLQQVEHEAYLTFLAEHAGVRVPRVVAAGRCGPSHDAALVTRLPEGERRRSLRPATMSATTTSTTSSRSCSPLRQAGIAHGALSPRPSCSPPTARCYATSGAPPRRPRATRTDQDIAAAVAARRRGGGGRPGGRQAPAGSSTPRRCSRSSRSCSARPSIPRPSTWPHAEGIPQVAA